MSIPVKRMLRTRGALAAVVTALSVGAALVAGQVLMILISLIPVGTSGLVDLQVVSPFAGFDRRLLLTVLPFTIGYFLGLWVIAPITEQLRIGHVITRAVLATGVGSTVHFLVIAAVESAGALAGPPSLAMENIQISLGIALQQALTGLIVLLPLGVLGGVLLWVRRTAKPSEHHIEGLIDV
jgi:hypothetical protein